jgi:hypothetical protein
MTHLAWRTRVKAPRERPQHRRQAHRRNAAPSVWFLCRMADPSRTKKAPPKRSKWTIDERLTKASLPRFTAVVGLVPDAMMFLPATSTPSTRPSSSEIAPWLPLASPGGSDLPTGEEARSQALKSARELWADAIKSGRPLGAVAVVIADELGGLTFVPMADALPKRPT